MSLPQNLLHKGVFLRTETNFEHKESSNEGSSQTRAKEIKLSVITVVLNNKGGVSKFIESAESSFSDAVEFILVDGGSEDGSWERIKESRDERILGWRVEDNGIFDAMNFGISVSTGRYVSFINSDDYLIPLKFDDCVRRLKYHFQPTFVHYYSDIYSFKKDNDLLYCKAPKSVSLSEFYKLPFFHCGTISTRESLYDLHGYNLIYRLSSDHDLYLRAFLRGHRFTWEPDVYVCSGEGGIGTRNITRAVSESAEILYFNIYSRKRYFLYIKLLGELFKYIIIGWLTGSKYSSLLYRHYRKKRGKKSTGM